MEKEETSLDNHKKISFTADHHPYWRTLGEFPFAQEIEDEVNGKLAYEKEFGENNKSGLLILPAFEARCKSTNELIRRYVKEKGIKQILSIAAGMEQRGIEFASTFPDLFYVETDISDIFEKKKLIADKIFERNNLPNRRGLFFDIADALDFEQLKKATSHFSRDKEILIVNEGLQSYYSEEENRKIAKNIHKLLSQFGGFWVTPDPSMNKENRNLFFSHAPQLKIMQQKIAEKTGRVYDEKGFIDDNKTKEFFESEGFLVKKYYRKDLGYSLITLNKSGLNKEEASKLDSLLNERFAVWVMRIK